MMAMAYLKQAQIQAERAQRAADGKKGVGPVEKAHIARTQANIAAKEAEEGEMEPHVTQREGRGIQRTRARTPRESIAGEGEETDGDC